MHRNQSRIVRSALAFVAALGLVGAGAAFAQQESYERGSPSSERGGEGSSGSYGDPRAESPGGESAASQFAQEDLQAFAEARQEVEKIGERYRSELGGGQQEPEARMETRKAMQEELVEAVRSSGLEIGAYNEIANAVANDPALARKVEELK